MRLARSLAYLVGALVLSFGLLDTPALADHTFPGGTGTVGSTGIVQFNVGLSSLITLQVTDASSLDAAAGLHATTLSDAAPSVLNITGFVPSSTCGASLGGGSCAYNATGDGAGGPGAWAIAAMGVSVDYAGCTQNTGVVVAHFDASGGTLTSSPPKACDMGNGSVGTVGGSGLQDCGGGTTWAGSVLGGAGYTDLAAGDLQVADTLDNGYAETNVLEVGAFVAGSTNVDQQFDVVFTATCTE